MGLFFLYFFQNFPNFRFRISVNIRLALGLGLRLQLGLPFTVATFPPSLTTLPSCVIVTLQMAH